jgi:hypothetical protein
MSFQPRNGICHGDEGITVSDQLPGACVLCSAGFLAAAGSSECLRRRPASRNASDTMQASDLACERHSD